MKKCLRCETEMLENLEVMVSNGAYGIEIREKGILKCSLAKLKCAVCPECGYTETYIEDTEKIKKLVQNKSLFTQENNTIIWDLKTDVSNQETLQTEKQIRSFSSNTLKCNNEKNLKLEYSKIIDLDKNNLERNCFTLAGKIAGEKKFSHEDCGQKFYVFNLSVPRLGGSTYIIPITISERLMNEKVLVEGQEILVKGQCKTYDCYENKTNKLIFALCAKDIEKKEENDIVMDEEITNEVVLIGTVTKKPTYLITPFGREKTNFLLSVNGSNNQSDFIQTITWAKNARFCKNLEKGTKVKIVGKVRPIEYGENCKDVKSITKVMYEVVIYDIQLINEDVIGKDK